MIRQNLLFIVKQLRRIEFFCECLFLSAVVIETGDLDFSTRPLTFGRA